MIHENEIFLDFKVIFRGTVKTGRDKSMRSFGKVNPVSLEYYRKPLNTDQRFWGTPGASLISSGFDEKAILAGKQGEQKVGAKLEQLAAQYPDMYVFHSVKLPSMEADIDHIVVQGDTVLLVDTKNWERNHEYVIHSDYYFPAQGDDVGDAEEPVQRKYAGVFVTRDGKTFDGGSRIHLDFYMKKWDAALSNSAKRFRTVNSHVWKPVEGILVIANNSRYGYGDFDDAFYFTNLDGLEAAFEATFTRDAEQVTPLTLDELRFFVDNIQSSATSEMILKGKAEDYFAYQVDKQPLSSTTTLMTYALIAGTIAGFLGWWGFALGVTGIAFLASFILVYFVNPKRSVSRRTRTGLTKWLSVPVIVLFIYSIVMLFR